MDLYEGYSNINILDLGCGVGRNVIPWALKFKDIIHIECVDILDTAIKKLEEYFSYYQISDTLTSCVLPLENYDIKENHYDLILAISSLEHIEDLDTFLNILQKIRKGLNRQGIVCLIINSEVIETTLDTMENLPPQFEINLGSEELFGVLDSNFSEHKVLKRTLKKQTYQTTRNNREVKINTNVITYIAKKQ